jgi:streptogramin lyase
MLRAIRHAAPVALAFLVHAAAAQPTPGLRFEAPPALQGSRPNGSFAAPGMAEDAAGFAWFATEAGLIRFDGLEARTYRAAPGGLASTLLYAVLAGPEGQLWVADGAGRLMRFDPLSGRADPVTFPVDGVRALFPALARSQGSARPMRWASSRPAWTGTGASGSRSRDEGCSERIRRRAAYGG